MKSEFASDKVEKYLKDYSDTLVKHRLAAKNLPVAVLKPFEYKREKRRPPEKVSGPLSAASSAIWSSFSA